MTTCNCEPKLKLRCENVSKTFIQKGNQEVPVIRDVTLDVYENEFLVILGPGQCGKSTLLKIFAGLETPDEGQILYHGEDILSGAVNMPRYHAKVGMVFQQFNLFPQYKVMDNLTLAPKLALHEQVKAAKKAGQNAKAFKQAQEQALEQNAKSLLERVGLADKADAYPCQLSGGQQQRVAIARALAMSPDILCFDEPTSALDPELTGEVLNVIRSLKTGNSTMIVVTHEMEFARHVADQVLFMADGVIAESGTPEDLFNHPKSPALQAFLSKAQNK